MEFFAIADVLAQEQQLHRLLTITALPELCASINSVLSHEGDSGSIYCVWGEFDVHREPIRGGVRFSLPGCPNALAWTVTTGFDPVPDKVVVHCTINRTGHDPDFIESLEAFVADWKLGLERRAAWPNG